MGAAAGGGGGGGAATVGRQRWEPLGRLVRLSSHTLSELRLTRLDERSDSRGPFCLSARAVVCVLAQRGGCARVVLSGLDGRRDDCGMAFGELVAGLGERDDCAGARGGVVGPGLDGLRGSRMRQRHDATRTG